ncbi:dual specificity protein phosphatase 22-B isoform X2 [Poecilia formosa]|uniref:dual specificity protein phosphatase 22-B isoform X2 n=1 Tax=Poecilia formosa TaxID=48698 RepID=UPI0007B79C71|nr:PREDICTED: dual specificity protein phosphatase 22 isoform X2 [Poecilia formosa]
MGNGISKILPDLYLGNIKDAQDQELLAKHNITHILSIHDTAAPVLEDMTYLCISASDHSKQNLIQYFRESIMFIHESRLKGEGCLIHWSVPQRNLGGGLHHDSDGTRLGGVPGGGPGCPAVCGPQPGLPAAAGGVRKHGAGRVSSLVDGALREGLL